MKGRKKTQTADAAGLGADPTSYAIDLGGERLADVTFAGVTPGAGSDLFEPLGAASFHSRRG